MQYKKLRIPIKSDVISDEHLKIFKYYNKMENEYVNKLNETYKINMSYEDNLKTHIITNKTSNSVSEIIWENIELAKIDKQNDGKHKQKRNP